MFRRRYLQYHRLYVQIEDEVIPDTEMGDVGECELGMCNEVSCEEVVVVLMCVGRGKDPSPNGILNEIMYGDGRLVEVMLQVINLVLRRSESYQEDWKRSLLVPLHKDGDNEEVGNYRGLGPRL